MRRLLPRRPLAFSLRTLLVLVAVACVPAAWLGSQWRVVRERRAVRESWGGDAEVTVVLPSAVLLAAEQETGFRWRRSPATIPRIRRWLGDKAMHRISFRGADSEKIERALRWFAEASVSADGVMIANPDPTPSDSSP